MSIKNIVFMAFIANICLAFEADVASVILKGNERTIEIKDQDVIGDFEVKILNNKKVVRNVDESLSFEIQLINIRLNGIYEKIKYLTLDGREKEVELLFEDNKVVSKPFVIQISKNFYEQARNRSFEYFLKISKLGDNKSIWAEIGFVITPDITLSCDKKLIDFGVLDISGGRLCSKEENMTINYKILSDAKCVITSKNGFNLKNHPHDSIIPYNIRSLDENLASVDSYTKSIDIMASCHQKVLVLNIDTYVDHIPLAGNYSDVINITIASCE